MPTYPDDDDGAALAQLAAQGADMTRPMLLEFAVAAPGESAAEEIRDALAQHGYQASVDYDEGEPDEEGEIDPDDEEFGPSWTIYVEVRMVPVHAELIRIQADLDHIASPLGGRSDGWGALLE